jgi:hypothetical protein
MAPVRLVRTELDGLLTHPAEFKTRTRAVAMYTSWLARLPDNAPVSDQNEQPDQEVRISTFYYYSAAILGTRFTATA